MMFEPFSIKHILPLLRGVLVTLRICGITILFATIIGIIVGWFSLSKNRLVSTISKAYVNIMRGIPLLVILFICYYGIPILTGVDISQNVASIGGLTIYAGAYISEIVRGSILSVPKGQTEAAHALGMNELQRMFIVIIPQAVRYMIPPFVGFIVSLIKDSSLVSTIGYIDLMRYGKIVSNLTLAPFSTYLCVAGLYFIICFFFTRLSGYLEKKLQRGR